MEQSIQDPKFAEAKECAAGSLHSMLRCECQIASTMLYARAPTRKGGAKANVNPVRFGQKAKGAGRQEACRVEKDNVQK